MHNHDTMAETFSGNDPAGGQTVVAPVDEEPARSRRYRENLARTLEGLRKAGAESASVHFTGWGCTLQFQGVRYTPAGTDGESQRVRLEVVRYDLRGHDPQPPVGLQTMSLSKALEVLAVAHGDRSGIHWNDAARVRTSVRVHAVDGSVGMTLRTP